VRIKGKKKYIGMYDTAKRAAEAHDAVAAKLKQAGGAAKPAFRIGSQVEATAAAGAHAGKMGELLSFDWIMDLYRIGELLYMSGPT